MEWCERQYIDGLIDGGGLIRGGLYSEVYGVRADPPCVYTALLYLHKFLTSYEIVLVPDKYLCKNLSR